VTKSFAATIEKMMSTSYLERPQAAKILRYTQLKKIQKQDVKQPRNNYCVSLTSIWYDFYYGQIELQQELSDGPFLINKCDNILDNNNIIETPRRPLFEVRNSL
jgi:hypothetical protein